LPQAGDEAVGNWPRATLEKMNAGFLRAHAAGNRCGQREAAGRRPGARGLDLTLRPLTLRHRHGRKSASSRLAT
jgi:hypothetical protein